MTFLKKIILFTLTFLFVLVQSAKQSYSEIIDDYDSYNIITAKRWYISPYVFAGYSFEYTAFNSFENFSFYEKSLKKYHHGYIIGAGVSINKNWLFGVSFQQAIIANDISGGEYANIVSDIKSEILMTNIDVAVKTPFTFFNNHLELLILGGANIIVSNLSYNFQENAKMVPVELVEKTSKPAFGVNLGLSMRYNIFKYLFVGLEAKRLFVLTSKSSIIKDTWLINGIVGINF